MYDDIKMTPKAKIEWTEKAISLYTQGLNMPLASKSDKASLHKNLSKAYEVLEEAFEDKNKDFGKAM